MGKTKLVFVLLLILFVLTGCSSNTRFSDEEHYINLVEEKLDVNNDHQIKEYDLNAINNPIGDGSIVYVDYNEKFNGEDIYVAWIIYDNQPYPLNGNAQDTTSSLGFLRTANKQAWENTNIGRLDSPSIKTLFEELIMVSESSRKDFADNFKATKVTKSKNSEKQNKVKKTKASKEQNKVKKEDDINEVSIKINSETSWRGVYGNNNGLEKISGEGNKELKVNDIEPIIATIQHTGDENKKVEVKIEKDNEVKEQTTLSSRYRSYMLVHYVDNGDFNNSNVPEDKLDPLEDEDKDTLDNLADPLPNYYGEVTEGEYKYLLDKWSKQTLEIVEQIIDLNNRYHMGEITQNKYINKLNNMSQFKSDKYFKVVLDDINSIVGPKRYMSDEYFWMAISDLDYVFYERFDPENHYGNSYKIERDLEEIISFLNSAYRVSNVDSVNKLRDKVIHLQNVL